MATELTMIIDELLILVPHLADALAKDEGGTAEAERVTGGADPAFGLPVNADVFGAMRTLDHEVPIMARWATKVIAEPYRARSAEGHLRHFPRWHERMLVTAAHDDADRLVVTVRALLSGVRLALGLRTPDRRLGQYCPLHDDPLQELVIPGEQTRLRITSGRVAGVDRIVRDEAVCKTCAASWTPGDMMLLRRQLREADNRRVTRGAA